MWDPTTYLAFADYRERPFHELLVRIGATDPRRVVDLGCGPGTLAPVLTRRWPHAQLEALDSSPEMVAAARERGIEATVTDVRDWTPREDTDVVVTNAVLQWVPGHLDLLRGWLAKLPAQAWFALQVPSNFDAPSHALVRELAAEPAWHDQLAGVLRAHNAVPEPQEYAAVFTESGYRPDVWETTYLQSMTGQDPVLEWITGTALRPVRAALDEPGWARFQAELAPRLRAAYPQNADGTTWFPFRRLFAVGNRE